MILLRAVRIRLRYSHQAELLRRRLVPVVAGRIGHGDMVNQYQLETIYPTDEMREKNTTPINVCGLDYQDAERR